MRIIIEHGTKKRQIDGPFNICGDKKDLKDLARLILDAIEDEHQPFSYGWIQINNYQKTIGDTTPGSWE